MTKMFNDSLFDSPKRKLNPIITREVKDSKPFVGKYPHVGDMVDLEDLKNIMPEGFSPDEETLEQVFNALKGYQYKYPLESITPTVVGSPLQDSAFKSVLGGSKTKLIILQKLLEERLSEFDKYLNVTHDYTTDGEGQTDLKSQTGVKGTSESLTENVSSLEGKYHNEGTSVTDAKTDASSTSDTKGHTEGTSTQDSTTDSTGKAKNVTHTDGTSESDSTSKSTTVGEATGSTTSHTDGTSESTSKAHTEGKTTSDSTGKSTTDSTGSSTDKGTSESDVKSIGMTSVFPEANLQSTGMGVGGGLTPGSLGTTFIDNGQEGTTITKGSTTNSGSTTGHNVTDSVSKNNGTSSSDSTGETKGKSSSDTKGTSKTDSTSTTDTTGHVEGKTSSDSTSTTDSENKTTGNVTGSSTSDSTGSTKGESTSTTHSEGKTTGDGTNNSDSTSKTTATGKTTSDSDVSTNTETKNLSHSTGRNKNLIDLSRDFQDLTERKRLVTYIIELLKTEVVYFDTTSYPYGLFFWDWDKNR